MSHLMNTYSRLPVAFSHGEGSWLTDTEGKRYLDALAGIAVSTLGHNHPALVTAWDNVHAQRRLLTEVFGVDRVACVYGWSMGAQQAYHWAAAFPGAVERIVAVCGSAKTAVHNQVFLRGLLAVLEAAPEYLGDASTRAGP